MKPNSPQWFRMIIFGKELFRSHKYNQKFYLPRLELFCSKPTLKYADIDNTLKNIVSPSKQEDIIEYVKRIAHNLKQ